MVGDEWGMKRKFLQAWNKTVIQGELDRLALTVVYQYWKQFCIKVQDKKMKDRWKSSPLGLTGSYKG